MIDALPRDVLAEAVRDLETDDVVDILEDLDAPQQDMILDALEDADRVAVEQAMAYPEYSAGRLMQREVVVAPEHWTVGEAIDFLREADHLPDQFYHVILVDPRMKPVGYVTLGRILSSRPRGAAARHRRGQFPHHRGDRRRGGRRLYLQPVSPDFLPGGGCRTAGWWASSPSTTR